ncbi:unnamed protein product [Durusdinium trenchii]|uniref:Amino acid transporter transmembrane domain-containing protein n=1 Tax=Durusdinium trenchii TaxID=1381693 RepID=A0ABP0RED4_9DINO
MSRARMGRRKLLVTVVIFVMVGCPSLAWMARPGFRSFTGQKSSEVVRWRQLQVPQATQADNSELAGGTALATETPKKATVMSTGVALAKGMLGSGALSLSAGAAAFTHTSQGLGVATLIILGMTMLSGYTFQMVAESSADTGAGDFGNTWAQSVGKSTAWLPRMAVGIMSFTTCTVYAMILADLTSSILQTCLAALPALGALKPFVARTPTLIGLTVFVLLPLCLAEDFSSLAFTSTLGLAACAYLALFSIWRAVDGSYLPGGKFFRLAPYTPCPLCGARELNDIVNPRALIFLSSISTAYMNHGMAPATFQELNRGVERSEGLRRYALAVLGAFGLAGFVCTALMIAGLYTFGDNVNGLLLSNYAGTDLAAALGKMGVLLSVLFGFPLNFLLLRTEVAAIVSKTRGQLDQNERRLLSSGLLLATALPALVLKDIGVVQATLGAIFGSYLVFIAPAAMSRGLRKQKRLRNRGRSVVEVLLAACGVTLGLLGLVINLRRSL